jgi:hypothetical protein
MVTRTKKLLNRKPAYIYGGLLKTRQTTAYHVGDDGDYEAGLSANYTVLTTGNQSGTTAIDVPHYAAATLTFAAADKSITDSANGLVEFLDTDTIRVRGSASNDGVYTIASGGGTAGHFHVTEALVNEAAAPYITLCKRSTPQNQCVIDNVTGLMWKRYTTGGPAERVGIASDGKLNWYDTLTCFTLHPAAADLQMMTTGIKIVGGAAEVARYFVGAILDPSGFANAVNNLPGYRVTAVAVNGADLDITLWTGKNTLIAEAAAGARDIRVVCQSIFGYAAAANAASFGGYTDWRIPNMHDYPTLSDQEAPTAYPDNAIFPGLPAYSYASDTLPGNVLFGQYMSFGTGEIQNVVKTTATWMMLVRG